MSDNNEPDKQIENEKENKDGEVSEKSEEIEETEETEENEENEENENEEEDFTNPSRKKEDYYLRPRKAKPMINGDTLIMSLMNQVIVILILYLT
jgi:uncharacterized membrane protein YdbT with pleckstrin-like domain